MLSKFKHIFKGFLLQNVCVIAIFFISGCIGQQPPTPDLMIESLTHSPATPTTADQVTLTAVVKNIGTGAAGSSTLSIKVGEETDPAKYSIPALEPGETYSVQRQVEFKGTQTYLIIVTAEVDVNNDVTEANEANNEIMDSFTVMEVAPIIRNNRNY